MSYTLIDSHCHITNEPLYNRIDEIICNAKAANVERMLIICTDFLTYERAKELKMKEDIFDIALGFHPQDLARITQKDYDRLEKILKEDKIVALGEIGLDYHYDDVPKELQKEGFIKQIELANKYHKPIIIHMREATEDTLQIIKNYAQTKFLMHCFSGSKETAKIIMDMNGYISFSGVITFKNAKGLLEVPLVCDIHRIMVETDCPYLTPHPFRGKENEVMYVAYTFMKVKELLNMGAESLASSMRENYFRFIE